MVISRVLPLEKAAKLLTDRCSSSMADLVFFLKYVIEPQVVDNEMLTFKDIKGI